MNAAKLDALIRQPVEAGLVPGVVASVTTREGVVYEGAFGKADIAAGTPMTPGTALVIASMTKALTGAVAMQLVERGKLALDAPAGELIPYLAEVQVCTGFDGDGQAILRPPRSPVTLRNLLTHTSGFVYDIWNADQARYEEVSGNPGLTAGLTGLRQPLFFDPGTRWEYGIGIDWAGQMVEAAAGQRLGAFMAENLFGPLGMNSTSFSRPDPAKSAVAKVHVRGPGGALQPVDSGLPETDFDMGGGGLVSTIPDYLRFLRMMLQEGAFEGQRLLRPETVAEMSRNQIGQLDVAPLVSNSPLSNTADFYPGMRQKWGLTFLINTERTAEGRSPGSLAWAGLANSYYWIDPVAGVGGAWATQLFPFFDDAAMAAFRAFERGVYEDLA